MKLSTLSTPAGMFSLLSCDQVVGIADHLGLNMHNPQEQQLFVEVLDTLANSYSSGCTGVLVAPELGYDSIAQIPQERGLVFSLERRLFDADPLSVPILTQHWGIEATKNNYGVAKLELFYNPEEKEALAKKQIVSELYDYCKHEGIDLILEVLLYIEGTEAEYTQRFPELQLQVVQEFRSLCSLMALEYPLSALGSVTITAELDIPWILTTRDTPYELCKEQLRTVLESGAKGFMAMEQFLPPVSKTGAVMFTPETMLSFIATTGRDRVLELSRIVTEAGEQELV